MPFHQIVLMLGAQMFGLAAKQFEIFRTIIRTVVVDVMHAFARFKLTTEQVFHHEAMFVNVAISIRQRMIRRHAKDVAVIFQSATLPSRMIDTNSLHVMAGNESQMFPFVIPTLGMIQRGQRRFLSAATSAKSIDVDGRLQRSSSAMNIAGIGSAGPMPFAKSFAFEHELPAPTRTQGVG
jgi:hypothetical protein